MYAGREIPGQTFDHTRRYQNDIVVYSENELRSVMGNLTRGTRVVIANDIYLTKSISVNIRSESLTKTVGVDKREVVVAGFGGGSLRRKSNVKAFDLFVFGPKQQDGITFSNLFISGFTSFIACTPSTTPLYHADLTIQDCYFDSVTTVFKLKSAGNVLFTRAKIQNNRLYFSDFYAAGTSSLSFIYSAIHGNSFVQASGSLLVLNTCTFTANNVSGPSIEFDGASSVIDGNVLRDVTFTSGGTGFILTNNKFQTGTPSLAT